MEKTSYGIFYNANSGDGQAEKIAKKVAKRLQANQIDSYLLSGKTVTAAMRQLQTTIDKIDTLIIIGGDGTINIAASVLLRTQQKIRLGIIPAGTINNFASRYHLPTKISAAIDLICQPTIQKNRSISLIACNHNQAVVSSLTFGNLADISNEVRQQEKRRFGKLVYLWKAIQHIGKNKSFKIQYQFDDGTNKILKTWFALITTTKSIGGHVYSQSTPAKMHISLLNNIGLKQLIPYLFFAFTGNLQSSKSVTQAQVTRATITSAAEQTIRTRIDGDEGITLPIELEYLPDYCQLIVPK